MSELIKASIVVPTHEASEDTAILWQSIQGQLGERDEVIIVDDGSSRSTQEALKRSIEGENVQMIFEKHRGPSHARNVGINQASGDYVVFVDSDTIADKKWLKEMKHTARKADAVQGNFWTSDTPTRTSHHHSAWRRVVGEQKRKKDPNNFGINTRNFGVSRQVLLDTVGAEPFPVYSSKYVQGEDISFGRKLMQAGVEVVWNPNAVVVHTGDPVTLRGLMRQKYHHGRGAAANGAGNPEEFKWAGFDRVVVQPVINGVSPEIAFSLYAAHVAGAASGRIKRRMQEAGKSR
jgi:glycosyltransferase involved in cell wall biosynthesis